MYQSSRANTWDYYRPDTARVRLFLLTGRINLLFRKVNSQLCTGKVARIQEGSCHLLRVQPEAEILEEATCYDKDRAEPVDAA